MEQALRGAAAGLVATGAMSAVMLAARRAGLLGRQPPEAIVRRTGRLLGAEPRAPLAGVLGAAAHVAFGAGTGAAYALLPRRGPGTAVALALAVWAVSYEGWVPALGALPPAHRDRPDRPLVMVAAHVVHGLVLAGAERRLAGTRR